jgi:putative tryptophan/tyrosine transport system ATP-binding protein
MLHLENINVSFGKNHILKNLSCSVEAGDFIVIVGANGAGKSTFFDTISGKNKPTRGNVILDGSDITALSEMQRAAMITRIFQNTRLNSVGSMTVLQNLAIAQYSRRFAKLVDGMHALSLKKAEAIMTELGMSTMLLDKKMNDLSGGQRQLVAFAMATQLIPKLLLLDEPTAALDPQAATTLLVHAAQFIKRYKITTILITHDPHIALTIGNKIWILENGTITQQYDAHAKKDLNPDKLIGQIDYGKLAKIG